MTASAVAPALRHSLGASDSAAIGRLVRSTGRFSESEAGVAVELALEHLTHGEGSGYWFTVADAAGGAMAGYACYGPIPCTVGSFDLYWIAVDPQWQGRGLGQRLMLAAESRMVAAGCRRVFVDTSGRPDYAPTRAFYASCGYRIAAQLVDFYGAGDDKVIFSKELTASEASRRAPARG